MTDIKSMTLTELKEDMADNGYELGKDGNNNPQVKPGIVMNYTNMYRQARY